MLQNHDTTLHDYRLTRVTTAMGEAHLDFVLEDRRAVIHLTGLISLEVIPGTGRGIIGWVESYPIDAMSDEYILEFHDDWTVIAKAAGIEYITSNK